MRNGWIAMFVLAAGVAAGTSYSLSQQSYAADTTIKQFTVATANSVLQQWGGTDFEDPATSTQKVNDDLTITYKDYNFRRNGLIYHATLFCSDKDGCTGLRITCAFDKSPGSQTLNAFNATYRAGKAYEINKVVVSERYLIVDGGVSRANLAMQLSVFDYATTELLQFGKGEVVASVPSSSSAMLASRRYAATRADVVSHVSTAEYRNLPVNRVGRW